MGVMIAVRLDSAKKLKNFHEIHSKSLKLNFIYNNPSEITPLILSFLTVSMPAQASGKVFDFNATLPAMAAQFLLLMVFLDKTWFDPIGKVLDERDMKIQSRLSSVQSGDDELEALAKEAENLLKTARS